MKKTGADQFDVVVMKLDAWSGLVSCISHFPVKSILPLIKLSDSHYPHSSQTTEE